jgi:hypothetical protein
MNQLKRLHKEGRDFPLLHYKKLGTQAEREYRQSGQLLGGRGGELQSPTGGGA